MIYLATPYTHSDSRMIDHRFGVVTRYAARLVQNGTNVYSPITHSHELQKHMSNVATTWDFWEKIDLEYLSFCESLIVLTQWGWRQSIGVQAELDYATEHNKPIEYHGIPTDLGEHCGDCEAYCLVEGICYNCFGNPEKGEKE